MILPRPSATNIRHNLKDGHRERADRDGAPTVANNLGLTEPMFTHDGQNIVKQANHAKANSFTKQKCPSQAGCCPPRRQWAS